MDQQPRVQNAGKWRRMIIRLRERAIWAAKGLCLWLLQRPYLRFLPLPYPSTPSIEKWKHQAREQVTAGTLPRRYLDFANRNGRFTMQNMGECIHLRSRLGLMTAFCEDPHLQGMVAALPVKGLASKIQKQVKEEAMASASRAEAEGSREAEARSMIGPKGGLPSLRGDLVRLAALLHVPLEDKDTIAQVKEKVKPMVAVLKEKPVVPVAKSKMRGARPKSSPSKAASSNPPLTMQNLADQQLRMGTVLETMSKELTTLRQQTGRRAALHDQQMEVDDKASEGTYTSEELRAAAESMEDVYAEQLAAVYGEEEVEFLTNEQIAIVLDP